MRVSASCDKRSKSTRRAYVVEMCNRFTCRKRYLANNKTKKIRKIGYPEHRIYIVKI